MFLAKEDHLGQVFMEVRKSFHLSKFEIDNLINCFYYHTHIWLLLGYYKQRGDGFYLGIEPRSILFSLSCVLAVSFLASD